MDKPWPPVIARSSPSGRLLVLKTRSSALRASFAGSVSCSVTSLLASSLASRERNALSEEPINGRPLDESEVAVVAVVAAQADETDAAAQLNLQRVGVAIRLHDLIREF